MQASSARALLVLLALGLAGSPVAGAAAAGAHAALPSGRTHMAIAVEAAQTIPVLAQGDVLIVEGTLAGCVAAWHAARQGRSVLVAASGLSLPHDLVAPLRPWAREDALAKLPAAFAQAFHRCVKERADDGELLLDLARLAVAVEDLLLDAGVRLFYGLRPCGVAKAGARVSAALFAGKGGLAALAAGVVVDCTPDARLAALAGARFADRGLRDGRLGVSYTLLCNSRPPRAAAVEGVPELADGKLIAHGPIAEFRMRLATRGDAVFRDAELALRARIVAANAGRALRGLSFARGGDALAVEPARRILTRSEEAGLGLASCVPQGVEGLLVCGPAADAPDEVARALADPFGGVALAAALAKADGAAPAGAEAAAAQVTLFAGSAATQPLAAGVQARLGVPQAIRRSGAALAVGGAALPVVADADVLVVGGGTSGVPAAIVAAHNGAKTLIVEKHSDFGGTHTLGGVSKYWFGRPTDFVRQLDRDALALLSGTGMPKAVAMLYALVASGASVMPQCLAVGALVEGNEVRGIVAATPAGLAALTARVVIDATGDGDIAAWAGAAHSWGTGRDALTLWFSFGQFLGPNSEASRQYHSCVDLRDPADLARALVAARRRTGIFGQGDFPQFYLAPRESRHIRGRATVTYGGILRGQRWPDVALVAESNFDIKGLASSDLALCGYTEREFTRNYSAAIPFRALVPQGLEGILVVGKAFSATHDALALARMQRDLMAMGGAAGLAAAKAVATRRPVAALDIADLQKGLIALGILRPSDLAPGSPEAGAPLSGPVEGAAGGRPPVPPRAKPLEGGAPEGPPPADERELAQLVRHLAADSLPLPGQARLLAHGDAALPLLRNALPAAADRGQVACARALCFLGDAAGAPILLAELQRQLAGDKLPASPRLRHEAPDHGYAPEPAFLIRLIGRARDPRLAPLLKPLAQRIPLDPQKADDAFEYVHAICYACERLADPAAIEALHALADKPGIRGAALPAGADPRSSVSHVAERHAYLELCVGRALARCGAPRGYELLIGYLDDIRGVLARSAHDELADLAGNDLGFAPAPWRQWLAEAPRPLPPKPYLRPLE